MEIVFIQEAWDVGKIYKYRIFITRVFNETLVARCVIYRRDFYYISRLPISRQWRICFMRCLVSAKLIYLRIRRMGLADCGVTILIQITYVWRVSLFIIIDPVTSKIPTITTLTVVKIVLTSAR